MPYRYPGYCGTGRAQIIGLPGTGMQFLTSTISAIGFGSLTELSEFPGFVARPAQHLQKFRTGVNMLYPYPDC